MLSYIPATEKPNLDILINKNSELNLVMEPEILEESHNEPLSSLRYPTCQHNLNSSKATPSSSYTTSGCR